MRRFRLPLCALLGFAALAFAFPDPAFAGAAGSGMPYSGFLNTVRNSLQGELALTLAMVCFTVGLAMWLVGQDLHGPVLYMVRGAIVCCMMLGVMTLITAFAVGGAVVA